MCDCLPITPTNSITESDFLDMWGNDYEFFMKDWRPCIPQNTEEELTLENVLDTHPKIQSRLRGHQKYPYYTGHSMMYIEGRHYRHKTESNTIMTVYDRPVVQSGQHVIKNITAIDGQLNFNVWREVELNKRNLWETIPEFLLNNAKLLSWKWHRFDHQMKGIFELPSINTVVTRVESSKASTGRPVSWFRWGGRYYNPAYLYTMKHDREFCFQIWSTQESYATCVSDFTNERICGMSSKEAKTVAETWTTPCQISHIVCHGQSPNILRFPDEYIPSKENPKRQKRARQKKTRGKSLSIVTNPNNLGYVTTFRVFYFHNQIRKWINLGLFPGNTDAKTWATIDLKAYNVVTNRLRVEPVDFYESGAFKLEVWGCKAPGSSKPNETKNTLEPVLYETTWPTTPEMRRKIWKGGRDWNYTSADHNPKNFYSQRRGKQARYKFQQECFDFVVN